MQLENLLNSIRPVELRNLVRFTQDFFIKIAGKFKDLLLKGKILLLDLQIVSWVQVIVDGEYLF